MRVKTWLAAALIVSGLLAGGVAEAQRGKAKGKHKESETTGDRIREVLPPSEMVFTEQERTVIVGYFHNHHGEGLPPGLAKRESLPPGLAKQLRARGTLPPGLQKKLVPVPVVLERRLRVLPTGCRRVVLGGNIIIMDAKTSLIYDIIRDVIP